jgi:hypothetical protein
MREARAHCPLHHRRFLHERLIDSSTTATALHEARVSRSICGQREDVIYGLE